VLPPTSHSVILIYTPTFFNRVTAGSSKEIWGKLALFTGHMAFQGKSFTLDPASDCKQMGNCTVILVTAILAINYLKQY